MFDCEAANYDAQAAGLVDALDTASSAITVFAPTDDAFAALADALHLAPEELLAKGDLLSLVRIQIDDIRIGHAR